MCPPFGGQHGPAQAASAGGGMFLISWRIVSEKLDPYWRNDSEKRHAPPEQKGLGALASLGADRLASETLSGRLRISGAERLLSLWTLRVVRTSVPWHTSHYRRGSP